MKKVMFVLMLVLAGCYYDEPTYRVKYAIDLDDSIIADVTYKYESDYKTEQINGNTWESESFTITGSLFYYYIKLNSQETRGTFYIMVDGEVHDTSSIVDFSTIYGNVFSGYLDMDGDETTSVDIEI